jgi:hypothetical protein
VTMTRPSWLALFAPIPEDADLTRAPAGEGDAIAGWEILSIHLSAGETGLRNVMVVVDGVGQPLSAQDWVMLRTPDGAGGVTSVHESVGGRLEPDGRFLGTRWRTVTFEPPGSDEVEQREAIPSPPGPEDIAAVHALVREILARATGGRGPARTTPG